MPIEITANFLAVLIFWPYGYLANACQLGEHVRWCISYATHYQTGAPGLDVENVWRADPIRQYR